MLRVDLDVREGAGEGVMGRIVSVHKRGRGVKLVKIRTVRPFGDHRVFVPVKVRTACTCGKCEGKA
jgi:hypothetical protein